MARPGPVVAGPDEDEAVSCTDLATLQRVIADSWDATTCDPVDLPWSPANPGRGQCSVTALVLNDLLGGELVLAEVTRRDGSRQGVHYWNRVGGLDLDLTRSQFGDDEIVGPGRVVRRPPTGPRRCRDQYERLRARVLARLPRGAAQLR